MSITPSAIFCQASGKDCPFFRRFPTVAPGLLREIQDPQSTASSVAEVAASDPALAALLLRTANGTTVGLSRTISSVSEAISHLSFATVKTMVVKLRLDDVLACKNGQAAVDSDDLWVHSLAVSYAAEYLAKKIGGVDPGFAATLGLMHDIGKTGGSGKIAGRGGGHSEQPVRLTDQPIGRSMGGAGDDHAVWAKTLPRSGNCRPI